jgi:hypothetical protein
MNSKNQAETLQEKVAAIANEPVATAISNLQNEYMAISKRLRACSVQIHGSVLNMLQTEFQLRQDETKNAISEYQHQEQMRREAQAKADQEKLEAEQAEIAAANKPKLVEVGQQGPVQ